MVSNMKKSLGRAVNCVIYSCLIDYQMPYNRVKHYTLIEIQKNGGFKEWDIRIFTNLYCPQTVT